MRAFSVSPLIHKLTGSQWVTLSLPWKLSLTYSSFLARMIPTATNAMPDSKRAFISLRSGLEESFHPPSLREGDREQECLDAFFFLTPRSVPTAKHSFCLLTWLLMWDWDILVR